MMSLFTNPGLQSPQVKLVMNENAEMVNELQSALKTWTNKNPAALNSTLSSILTPVTEQQALSMPTGLLTPNTAALLQKIQGVAKTPQPYGHGHYQSPYISHHVHTQPQPTVTPKDLYGAHMQAAPSMEILAAASVHATHNQNVQMADSTGVASGSGPGTRIKRARGNKREKAEDRGHIPHTRTTQKFTSQDEIIKYDEKRDRNNMAVRKCREKKRLETNALNDRVSELEASNIRLNEELTELRREYDAMLKKKGKN